MFFTQQMRRRASESVQKSKWAKGLAETAERSAKWWAERTDDELWDMMFGPCPDRSWTVWSDGFCPACKEDVRMYLWVMDPVAHPWKTSCPHCKALFPTNDYHAFYKSGLNAAGIFEPGLADRSLLFNTDHPDPADPLHLFGVDDGDGYFDGTHRWRFIGAYLIFGQWKSLILKGLASLAAAYVISDNKLYAHKAAVLLDRVADLHPLFDYGKQGFVYEVRAAAGYVSTWHDACEESRNLGMVYDAISDGIEGDDSLVAFLQEKARKTGVANPKASIADIRANIIQGLFTDVLTDPENPNAFYNPKINSNYPTSMVTAITLTATVGGEQSMPGVMEMLDVVLETACKYDGLTGERGLVGYSAISPRLIAKLLGYFTRVDDTFLSKILKRHPRVYDMFRFHIDTWCLDGSYYPQVGDSHHFADKYTDYGGVEFTKDHSIDKGSKDMYSPFFAPSMFTFLYQLYKETGDKDFLKVILKACGGDCADLPFDLFVEDPEAVRAEILSVGEDARIEIGDVIKKEWGLGILRSGKDQHSRALWLQFAIGGGHCHADGMNLGLFGHGLDLLPDFGYPQVQFGGWETEQAQWYRRTAAHNTVMVDCKDDNGFINISHLGEILEHSQDSNLHYVTASCPSMVDAERFERTCALADISDEDFYVLDVFRVKGGSTHSRVMHSYFGSVTPDGFTPKPADALFGGSCMRNFASDPNPKAVWSVDWKKEDKLGYLSADTDMHLRLTDLTEDTAAYLCEGWIQYGGYWTQAQTWIPFAVSHRSSDTPGLESVFVSIIEPYNGTPLIESAVRLQIDEPAAGAGAPVAIEVRLADKTTEIWVFQDVTSLRSIRLPKYPNLTFDSAVSRVRI